MTSRLQLFHGTVYDLVGTHVRPGVHMGASAGTDYHRGHGQSYRDVVSASSDESKAWGMAPKAGGGRQRVWRVEPHPETRVGVENREHPAYKEAQARDAWSKPLDNDEYVAPSFRVLEQLDIKPGQQGTFPQIDWNRHAPRGHVFDANHPPHPNAGAQHRRALIEHRARTHGAEEDRPEAWRARQASKAAPQTETPGQLELHLGPQFRSTT